MATSEPYPPGYLDEYSGNRLIGVTTAFLVLNVVFVPLRFYARHIQRRKLLWDDWILIPALVFNLAVIAVSYVGVYQAGVGRHIPYVLMHPEKWILYYKLYLIVIPVLVAVSMTLPKLSICGLYLQVFTDKPSRYITYGVIAALIINCIVLIPIEAYRCNPISYGWRSVLGEEIEGAWCKNVQPRFVFASLGNIITDVVMMALPVPLIWRLQTNRTTKVGLAALFALGSAGTVTSVLRMAEFARTTALIDATWTAVPLVSWIIVEPGVYVMAACVIALRPLAIKLLALWRGGSETSHHTMHGYNSTTNLAHSRWYSQNHFTRVQHAPDHRDKFGSIKSSTTDESAAGKGDIQVVRDFDLESMTYARSWPSKR